MTTSIFITGTSSGIGHALAEFYLDQGFDVFGCSRRACPKLESYDGFRFSKVDLTDESQIELGFHELFAELLAADSPRLDRVILNAGILGNINDMRETPVAEMQNTMNANVWANKVVLDWLLQRLTLVQVVAISSGASVGGNRGWNGYSISKAALNMLVKLYSREVPQTHFSAFAPGLVDTAMQAFTSALPTDERFQSVENLKKRRGTPDMPSPENAAEKLATAMEALPELIESGQYVDVRQMTLPPT